MTREKIFDKTSAAKLKFCSGELVDKEQHNCQRPRRHNWRRKVFLETRFKEGIGCVGRPGTLQPTPKQRGREEEKERQREGWNEASIQRGLERGKCRCYKVAETASSFSSESIWEMQPMSGRNSPVKHQAVVVTAAVPTSSSGLIYPPPQQLPVTVTRGSLKGQAPFIAVM